MVLLQPVYLHHIDLFLAQAMEAAAASLIKEVLSVPDCPSPVVFGKLTEALDKHNHGYYSVCAMIFWKIMVFTLL